MAWKPLLSTLWVAVSLNYVFRFLFSLYNPERLRQVLDGSMHGLKLTEGTLLALSLVMELPIVMIVASRLLPDKAVMICGLVVALLLAVVHLTSLNPTGVSLHYYFFTAVGLVLYAGISTATIIWWTRQPAPVPN